MGITVQYLDTIFLGLNRNFRFLCEERNSYYADSDWFKEEAN
jgi:hypothetical protein